MTTTTLDATYTLKRVQEMLGLSRTTISGLIAAGFVVPVRGAHDQHRFSFQDLMLMRTAFSLQQASIPPRKILRSLARLKAALPTQVPLTGLRITAVGTDVAVRDRTGQWGADSGQLLMDRTRLSASHCCGSRESGPYLDLGALMCEAGRCADAVQLYEGALTMVGHEPLIQFNLAIALEDLEHFDSAILAYEHAAASGQRLAEAT